MSPRVAILLAVLVLAWLVGVPLAIGDWTYQLGVLTQASALSVIAAGVWLVFYIGRIHIGQGAFALLGQYAAAIAITKLGLSFWVALPLAGLVSALFACANRPSDPPAQGRLLRDGDPEPDGGGPASPPSRSSRSPAAPRGS